MRNVVSCISIALLACASTGCDAIDRTVYEALLKQLNEEASVENAKVKIAFDAKRETIISETAPSLVTNYELNLGYRKEDVDDRRPERFDAFRAVSYPNCAKPPTDTETNYRLGGTLHRGVCALHIFDEAPPQSALTTQTTWQTIKVKGRNVRRLDLTIRRPDGRKAVLVFYPGRSDLSWVATDQIAATLGLRPRGANAVDMLGPDEVDRLIEVATTKAGNSKYAWLDGLTQRDPSSDENLSASHFEPLEIAKRGEALTQRFEQMAPQADKTRYWRFVGELLARLPQSDWVRYRDRIAAAMVRAPKEEVVSQLKLIHRMTDMGANAGPVLALATSSDRYQNEIAIAACRVGAPIGAQLGQILLADWAIDNSPRLVAFDTRRRRGERGLRGEWRFEQRREAWERCTEDGKKNGPPPDITFSACWAIPESTPDASPTYLALRRMGLGAQADAMMMHQYSIHWKKTYATIGPASPAEVCGESREM